MKWPTVAALCVCLSACSVNQEQSAPYSEACETLTDCLSHLESIEVGKYGISAKERELAEQFTRFGEPALIELLQRLDIEEGRRKIVGYAISQFDPIDEKYLPQIVAGVKNDVSWLPNALGNIPTAEAAEAAVDAYLTSSSSPHNQEANAVVKQGRRAVPIILERAQCGQYCKEGQLNLLIRIVAKMDYDSKAHIATEILEALERKEVSNADRANLIELFFDMGPAGLVVEKDLVRLHDANPKLRRLIDGAFIGIHSTQSGRVFAELIRSYPTDDFFLRDVAELGTAAADAGPAILELLARDANANKVAAVRTLAFLEYAPAQQKLIELLKDASDVQLNWVAVNALGRLGEASAIPALEKVVETHWHTAVKEEARVAIERIRQGKVQIEGGEDDNSLPNFFAYEHLDVKSCEDVSLKKAESSSSVRLERGKNDDELAALSYSSYIVSYGASDADEQKANDPNGVIEVGPYNMIEIREEVQKIPGVALRVDGGWLTGYDGGEWGGELMFIPSEGAPMELLTGNVHDLFRLGDFYVAVTGLAHLSMNDGMIYRIERVNDEWKVSPWRRLPGAPKDAWQATGGEVVVDTYGGGTIVVSENGDMHMAPCSNAEMGEASAVTPAPRS